MKRIGVISDTHIPGRMDRLPTELLHALTEVDCIIHAGDIVSMPVIDHLKKIAPVYAVCGNMDTADVRHQLPSTYILEIEGKKIGITHGAGDPFTIKKRILKLFRDSTVDCIVFGHTHHAEVDISDGILLVNPGSPTDRMFTQKQSFALLTIDDAGQLTADIINF